MSTIDKTKLSDKKMEKINGKKMVCYYGTDGEAGAGKSCLYKGVFAYGEYTYQGNTTKIHVDDYKNRVRNSVFKAPSEDEILSPKEMMKLFQ